MKQSCTVCGADLDTHQVCGYTPSPCGMYVCSNGYSSGGAAVSNSGYASGGASSTMSFSVGGFTAAGGSGGAGGGGGGAVYTYTIPAYPEPELVTQYLIDDLPIDEYEIAVIRELRKRRTSED